MTYAPRYLPGTTLTAYGAAVVAAFNREFLYARCNRCGILGSPPRGPRYPCPLATCDGVLVAVDPNVL